MKAKAMNHAWTSRSVNPNDCRRGGVGTSIITVKSRQAKFPAESPPLLIVLIGCTAGSEQLIGR